MVIQLFDSHGNIYSIFVHQLEYTWKLSLLNYLMRNNSNGWTEKCSKLYMMKTSWTVFDTSASIYIDDWLVYLCKWHTLSKNLET